MKTRAILAAALTAPAVVIATQLYFAYRVQGIQVPFLAAFVTQLCHWELWAIAGPFVWGLERRWPLSQPGRGKALARHAVASVLVATAVLFLYMAFYHVLIRVPAGAAWFATFDRSLKGIALFFFVAYFHVELMIYGAIVAMAHAAGATARLREKERDALRLEAALTGAKLTALRTQLQPHFLFNTLHTVGSLVLQREHQRAVGLLAELGELLRSTLAHRDTDLTPLSEEIAYLRRYLRIEEARFGDRLTVEWNIHPDAMAALVPPFILQPLVENAFRHGISRVAEDAMLHIGAAVSDGALCVTIYNDGPALTNVPLPASGGGYGLANVEQRLTTRLPPGHLVLRPSPRWPGSSHGSGVCAKLTLPLWEAAPVAAGA